MNDFQVLSMLFLGMAIGTLSPYGIWGLVVFMAISTALFIIGIIKENRERLEK
jgi:hypothetical protein